MKKTETKSQFEEDLFKKYATDGIISAEELMKLATDLGLDMATDVYSAAKQIRLKC